MKIITFAVAAGLVAACTSQPQHRVVVTTPPPKVKTVSVPEPPPPATRTTVVYPAPAVTVVQPRDEGARKAAAEAEARARDAEARAAEAERLRQAEAAQRTEAEEQARTEAAARADAERRAGDIERELAAIAAVQQTERGLVVTLSGDVLFEFDRAALLAPAQTKLGQLADTLKRTDRGVTIEGHTDAVGADGYNRDLSYRRALAVRDHLVSRGVPVDRLKVVGHGKTHPVADNTSPEGRAMNRRVELIIDTESPAK